MPTWVSVALFIVAVFAIGVAVGELLWRIGDRKRDV